APVGFGDQVPKAALALHRHPAPVGHEDLTGGARRLHRGFQIPLKLCRQRLVLLADLLAGPLAGSPDARPPVPPAGGIPGPAAGPPPGRPAGATPGRAAHCQRRASTSVSARAPPARTASSKNGLTPNGTNRRVSSKMAWQGANSAVKT